MLLDAYIHSPSPHFVSSRVYGSQFGGEDFKKEEKKRGKSVEENGRWIRAVRFDGDEGIGGGRERVWDTCFFLPFFSLLLFLAREENNSKRVNTDSWWMNNW